MCVLALLAVRWHGLTGTMRCGTSLRTSRSVPPAVRRIWTCLPSLKCCEPRTTTAYSRRRMWKDAVAAHCFKTLCAIIICQWEHIFWKCNECSRQGTAGDNDFTLASFSVVFNKVTLLHYFLEFFFFFSEPIKVSAEDNSGSIQFKTVVFHHQVAQQSSRIPLLRD